MLLFNIFFAFWLNFLTPQQSNNYGGEVYQVVFVQGNIQNQTKNQAVTRGAKLSATDKIAFKSKDAKAVVISTTRGRFVMEAKKSKQVGNEFISFVSEVVSPLKTNSKLSTRANHKEEKVLDFEKFFGLSKDNEEKIGRFAILGDELQFKIDKVDESTGLVLAIHYKNGTKPAHKKMKFEKGIYSLSKELYFKDGMDNVKFVEVYKAKFSKENKKPDLSEVKARFLPWFLSKEERENVVNSFKEYLPNINIDETLKTYMSNNNMNEEQIKEALGKMNDTERKAELLDYFIQEGFGETDDNGVIDANKIKFDGKQLIKFVQENKF